MRDLIHSHKSPSEGATTTPLTRTQVRLGGFQSLRGTPKGTWDEARSRRLWEMFGVLTFRFACLKG